MQVLTSSKARSLAETAWGRGGTKAERTNRKGAYYFHCSGHGGYVVDGRALTKDERANIDKYVSAERVLVVTYQHKRPTFIQNPFSVRRQSYVVTADMNKMENYPIYFFEEDCDWAALEKFTDIRAGGRDNTEHVEKTFTTWLEQKAA